MLFGTVTLILKEVMVTLLSNEIRKIPNQEEHEGSGLIITGRKGRGGKEGLGSSKVCYFCDREGHSKKNCKHRQEWLKKKRQTLEANIVLGVSDTKC